MFAGNVYESMKYFYANAAKGCILHLSEEVRLELKTLPHQILYFKDIHFFALKILGPCQNQNSKTLIWLDRGSDNCNINVLQEGKKVGCSNLPRQFPMTSKIETIKTPRSGEHL